MAGVRCEEVFRGLEAVAAADIDEAGFVVVDQLLSAAPAAATWRYDAGAYLSHLGVTATAHWPSGVDALRELHAENCIPLHEEALLTSLLDDLSDRRVALRPFP